MASFTIGGVKPKNININGTKCKKVTVNGATIWTSERTLAGFTTSDAHSGTPYETIYGPYSSTGWFEASASENISCKIITLVYVYSTAEHGTNGTALLKLVKQTSSGGEQVIYSNDSFNWYNGETGFCMTGSNGVGEHYKDATFTYTIPSDGNYKLYVRAATQRAAIDVAPQAYTRIYVGTITIK